MNERTTTFSSSHKYVFYFYFYFYTLLNFTILLDYVCKQMNERPPLSDLIRERRTGTRWRGSTYGAGDVCGSSPHSTFILLLFFYSTKFIFLLDYLIERANGHLDRHTQLTRHVYYNLVSNSSNHVNDDDWARRRVWRWGWRCRRLQPLQVHFFFFFLLYSNKLLLFY